MNDIKQATRKESMKQNFDILDLPKSGFNLTYNSHIGGLPMGRMIPTAYQYIMAGDKFSGRNDYELIAEQLSTPVVSDVRVSVHNFFTTFRSIDKGFTELQTPTKLNSMSANVSTPQFRLFDVVRELFIELHELFPTSNTAVDSAYKDYAQQNCVVAQIPYYSFDFSTLDTKFDPARFGQSGHYAYILRNCAITQALKNSYHDDTIEDLIEQIKPIAEATQSLTTLTEYLTTYHKIYCCIFDFFCGEGSLMDYFGAPIFSHEDVLEWLVFMGDASNGNQYDFRNPDVPWAGDESLMYYSSYTIDQRYIWEYPFRAYYAIWFEHYRNMWLEPRSANLPEYSEFGSTPLISGSNIANGIATLLVTRIMPWTDDPFNTSQIDDISRHVYAPIITPASIQSTRVNNEYSTPSLPAQTNFAQTGSNYQGGYGDVWQMTEVIYTDQYGLSHSINCPLPDALSGMDLNVSYDTINGQSVLDLFTLKKAKMLERFLKRNFAFGDEYRDRLKAQYGVTIEDYRINRPHYLRGSVDKVDIKQEVANTGAQSGSSLNQSGVVAQGTRLATGSISQLNNSDGFTFFATEFGIYISLTSICPAPQYNHTDPILFTQKMQDFPIPVFAMQQEDINNSSEMYRTGFNQTGVDNLPFGHVPYAHGWRYRIDEVHGHMLSSKFDYTFARFYRGLTNDGVPKLNYWFLHCRPNLPMFTNSILLDGQFYGTTKHSFLVERLLPQPIESI